MFTGIIEEIGEVGEIRRNSIGMKLCICAHKVLEGTKSGDSINVDGVCLTVTQISDKDFTADVVRETMLKTSFSHIRRGDKVNLERALQLSGRLGGHLVNGHVDGTGRIVTMNAGKTVIECSKEIMRYIFPRASVAVDGISLTVQKISNRRFEIALIPHTSIVTTLATKRAGELVNLEADLISKQLEILVRKISPFNKGGLMGIS